MDQIIKPESVDFNELIQNNKTLTSNCQCKMVEILNEEFTQQESRWYIANLYVYMNYHPTNDYPINLDTLVKLVGFAHKKNAKTTLENNFIKDEDYKILLTPKGKQISHGGHNKEQIMLNVDTFKNMCMLVKTQKAKEIRKYYVKLENIYNKIIKEEIENQKSLLQKKQQDIEEKNNIILNNAHNKKIEKHDFLIDKFKYKKCIYVAEIHDNLIKIGSSKNIEDRLQSLKREYGKCTFLDIYESDNFRDVEESILKDNVITKNLYNKPIHKNNNPREVLQLSNSFTYTHLIEIIKNYIKQVVTLSPEQQLESKRIDFLSFLIKEKRYSLQDIEKLSNIKFNSLNNINANDDEKDTNDTNNKDIDNINFIKNDDTLSCKRLMKAKSVDKIHPETLLVLETYESIGAVINSHKEEKYEYSQLYKSIVKNNIYRNYRWNYHGKEIKPTVKITKCGNPVERIIKLNQDKTLIVEIYKTKKELLSLLNLSHKPLTKIINDKIIHNGFYYIKESECKELVNNYEKFKNDKYVSSNAVRIKQTNLLTKEQFIYNSMQEVYRQHGLCRQTIRKYINSKKEYCGFLWEYI
jgi:phage anti-repressor protein